MIPDDQRKLGRFRISMELIERQPGVVKRALSGCIVLEAAYRYEYNAIEYLALHDDFPVCPPCQTAPRFDVAVTDPPPGVVAAASVRFVPR